MKQLTRRSILKIFMIVVGVFSAGLLVSAAVTEILTVTDALMILAAVVVFVTGTMLVIWAVQSIIRQGRVR